MDVYICITKIIKYLKKEYYTSIEKGVREYIAWYKDFYG